MTQPLIGVGVPVWRGSDIVAETLQSVLDQRGVHIRIFVSIDGDDRESEAACRPFAADPRVSIVVQPRRLGWVKNTAAVLAGASGGSEFVCVQPHDDLIESGYLAALLDTARDRPQAAVVFSDLDAFGTRAGVDAQDSVVGTPMARQLSLLKRHYNAVAYRGLTRTSALRSVPPITGNDCHDFACDTVWMARLARAGELIRVPQVLYHKRFGSGTTHEAWEAWPAAQKASAWIRHCLDMLAEALIVAADADERRSLIDAARARLLLSDAELGPYAAEIRSLSPGSQWRMRARFEASAAARPDIGALGSSLGELKLRLAGRFLPAV